MEYAAEQRGCEDQESYWMRWAETTHRRSPVKGAVDAVNARSDIQVLLVGQEDVVREELAKYTYPGDQIQVVHAEEVIETAEPPVNAIRRKKQSSIVIGMNMVKQKEADAFVSAGSSGAILVGGQVIVGRIKGIERPPLAPLIPTEKGVSLLIDCGANVDARASHLVQFAKMGSIYMENVLGVKKPRVAIVNIGAEEEKGNALVKETFPLLKACEDINFVGSIEAREIPKGEADVIVCEAFVGNVILKLYEGLSSTLIGAIKKGMMSTLKSKIGAALALPGLKVYVKDFRCDTVRRCAASGTERSRGQDARKCKSKRDYEFYFPVCDVQGRGHQWKDQENIVSSAEQEGM